MEIVDRLDDFIRSYYDTELVKASSGDKALIIDFSAFDRFDPLLADQLLEDPENTIKVFDEAASRIANDAVRVRIRNLPESRGIRIRNLRAKHLGKFLSIDAIIKAASEVRPQIYEAIFVCPECSTKLTLPQETNIVQKPTQCECGRRGDFKMLGTKMYDIRWLTAIEPFEITSGEQAGQISIMLKEDLTTPRMQKKTDPGSRLRISGILKELPKRIKGKMSTKMDMYVLANHVETSEIEFDDLEITPEEEKIIKDFSADPNIYEKLIASIAPGIYGFDDIKESIVLQLFGGVPHTLPDGSRIRGNIHILLTGDPGVGKTVLLKLVSTIVPRGRYVSGSGVSGAGLCTTYDTMIVLDDGKIRKIGELVEEKSSKLEEVETGMLNCDGDGLKVMALDQKTLKIRPMKITKYWKIKSPKSLVKITTRSGKEIRVTKNNPMPIIENGELLWKYAKDMNAHDYIACPRKLTCNVDNKIRLEVDTTARLVNCGETVSNMLEKIREKGSIKDFIEETGVSKQGLYWWWKNENSAPTIQTLEIIGSKLGINVYDLLPEEMILTQHRGTFIKLPKNLNEEIMYFFGLIAGDGDIAETGYGGFSLRFHSASHELLDKFSHICRNNFGTEPEYYKHPERIAYMRINSKILGKIAQLLGIPSGKKSQRLTVTELLSGLPDNLVAAYLRGLFDTDGCVVERNTRGANYVEFTTASKELAYGISLLLLRFDVVSKIRKRAPSVSEIKGRKVISKGKYQIEIKGLNNLTTFRELLGFNFSGKKSKLDKIIAKISSANTNVDVIPSIASLLRKARLSSGFTSKDLYGYKSYAFERGLMNPSRNMAISVVNKFDNKDAKNEFINKLRILANSDIFWDEVKSVESVAGEDYVYDLTVEEEHSFVANGMIIHNTATVVKNEAIGGWVLEAGALILCNKGLISIDEFDKMSRDDQIAMHEATSVETVSIAKASIVATLPAQTAVLAGANPKLGRFDPYVPITEQINIPETLLSRFDLKFALRDIPDRVRDEKIAGHVITSRTTPDFVEPPINTHLLRKYIAYAKSATNVELLPEASELLKNFYVEMRNQYPSEGVQPVSITLRQYEALIRLAEASAKVRLDTKVRLHDAERAVRLMKVSLYQLGYDIETGKIDIDRMESGVTASKRRKIGIILEILEKLQKELGHEVQKEDLKAEAENQGIVEGVDDIIDRLIREGTIFEPRPGFIRRV